MDHWVPLDSGVSHRGEEVTLCNVYESKGGTIML